MRKITKLIIHCSATPEGRETSVDEITNWHVNPKDYFNKKKEYTHTKYRGKTYYSREYLPEDVKNKHGRGWSDIGYHFIIHLDGVVSRGRDVIKTGAHCRGQNTNSIGVSYVGGVDVFGKSPKDTRTEAQKHALKILVEKYQNDYPGITIHGHYEFSSKACPSFNVSEWLKEESL